MPTDQEIQKDRWTLTLIRRGAKVPDDGTRWWQELPADQTADGLRGIGYEVVEVCRVSELEAEKEKTAKVNREKITNGKALLAQRTGLERELEAAEKALKEALREINGHIGTTPENATTQCIREVCERELAIQDHKEDSRG